MIIQEQQTGLYQFHQEFYHHQEPDIAFGLCDLGMGCPELGSVRISELENLTIMNGIFSVERDFCFEAEFPMSVFAFAAHAADMVTTDQISLNKAAEALQKKKLPHLKP